MFSNRQDAYLLKQTLELATKKYDDYLLSQQSPNDLIASCAYNVTQNSETGKIETVTIGGPTFVIEQFIIFFDMKYASNHSDKNNYLLIDYAELEARKFTIKDQELFLEQFDAALNPGFWSRCSIM